MSRTLRQKKNRAVNAVLNSLMTVDFFVFLVTASTFAVLAFTPAYGWLIKALKVPEETGYSFETCVKNYRVLIDYNMFFGAKTLAFPDFPMSIQGATHFKEVKDIFVVMQYAAIASGALLIPGIVLLNKRRTYWWRKATIILTLGVILAVGVGMLFDWEGVFTLMHKILFRNDYWIFNPATDPVIYILPDAVFLSAGAAILVLMAIGLVISGIVYRKKTGAKRAAAQNREKKSKSAKKNG